MPALLQAFARLVALKRLGILLFVVAATLCASSTASAFEHPQTKTRVWGFDFAEHNSSGLLSAATHGKHQGNRSALSELVSGSLLAAEELAPSFGNLGDQAAGRVLGTLNEGPGGYEIGGELADGSYDFVVQNGQTIVGKGHAALSAGERVTFAGEATFRAGELVEWTNASGHFTPAAAFARVLMRRARRLLFSLGSGPNAGLPMSAFRPVQFPGFVGGPQLPVFH